MAHWDRRELNKLVAESPEEYKKRFPEPFSAMIPEDASSENKLATEAYVNEHGGGEAVKYTEQTLTAEQKAQALANIGAASEGEVSALADQKYEGPYATDGDLPAASASTMGAIYLVGPDANDEYERKVTKLSGSTYSWVSIGKTAINLANYATKSEVTELEHEVTDLQGNDEVFLNEIGGSELVELTGWDNSGYVNTSGITVPTSGDPAIITVTENIVWRSLVVSGISGGDKFVISGEGGFPPLLWAFADSAFNILSKAERYIEEEYLTLTAPANAAYLIINDKKTGGKCYSGQSFRDFVEGYTGAIGKLQQEMALDVVKVTRQSFPNEKTAIARDNIYAADMFVVGWNGGGNTTYTSDNLCGFFWGGSKVYAANSGFDGILIPIYKGRTYKMIGSAQAFYRFNSYPVIDSAVGYVESITLTVNLEWVAPESGYLLRNFKKSGGAVSFVLNCNSVGILGKTIPEIHQKALQNGKTIVCFGDSITEFSDSTHKGYSDYMMEISDVNVIRVGFGGTQFRQRTTPVATPTNSNEAYAALDICNIIKAVCEDDYTKQEAAVEYLAELPSPDDNTEVLERLQAIDWTKVDAVTIFAGTNDWFNGKTLGTSGSEDVGTTLGAINYIIKTLLTTFPSLKIYWFTPIVRWDGPIGERTDANWAGVWQTTEGKTLLDYVDAIAAEVRNGYNLPVCDLYRTLGWNKINFSAYFYDNDGVHPYKGFYALGWKIMSFIQANLTF